MENNNRRMPEAVKPLYFVVDEKMNSADLTDKGVDWLTNQVHDKDLFVLPDIASELSALENEKGLSDQERLDKRTACCSISPCKASVCIPCSNCSRLTPCSTRTMNM